ncbi:MAG: HDOD domain-containing protein [Desulfomonilia bacterium]
MRKDIFNRIRHIEDLPTLPSVAMEVISLAQSPNVSIQQISEAIYRDPPLAAKVLKVGNSAFYRRGPRTIDTLHNAIILMGLTEVINITTSISIMTILPQGNGPEESIRAHFWDHSVATGLIARHIDRKLGMKSMGKEFVGGLLHDIGKIILDEYFHDEFMQAHTMSLEQNRPIHETEKEICGTTHMEIGHFLAQKWNLPAYLADIVLWHHQPSMATFRDITSLISLANLLAKAKELSCGGDRMSFILSDEESWHILVERGYRMNELDLERITFEMEALRDEVNLYISTVTDSNQPE